MFLKLLGRLKIEVKLLLRLLKLEVSQRISEMIVKVAEIVIVVIIVI